MPKKPPMGKDVREQMASVVAAYLSEYAYEFTKSIFTDFKRPDTQDCIVSGFAKAVEKYETATGVPIRQALALQLLEDTKEST